VLILGGVLASWASDFAWAQTILFTPSLTIGEEHDDNITRSSTNPQSDFLTSITPELRLEIRDHPWYLTTAGSMRGEFYASHSDLNNFGDNASGSGTLEFKPTRSLTLSMSDTFVRTLDPTNIDPVTGLTLIGRSVSTSNTVTPRVSYQVNPLTLLGSQYSWQMFRSDSQFAQDSDTHTGEFSVARQLTPIDSLTFRYTFNRFQVEGSPDTTSHLPRLGIAHAFSPAIRVSAEAGPLFLESDDASETTVGGTVRYDQQFSQGSFSVVFDRSPALAGNIGQAGVTNSVTTTTNFPLTGNMTLALNSVFSDTESSATTPGFRVFSNSAAINYQPRRSLSIDLQGNVSDNQTTDRTATSGGVDFLAYTASIQVTYVVLRWLSIRGGYNLERQDDRVGSDDLRRNLFFVRFTVSDQFRAY